MRNFNIIKNVFVVLCLLTTTNYLSSQISTFPYFEDFELAATGPTSCGPTYDMSPVMWENEATADVDWTCDVGGTSSGSTGPAIDHTLGTTIGKYIYAETSCSGTGNPNSSFIANSPIFDFSGATSAPFISFWYHMYGLTQGNMSLDVSMDGGATWMDDFFVPAWTDNQDLWQERSVTDAALVGQSNVQFRIRYISGTGFTGDAAFDDFMVCVPSGSADLTVASISPSDAFCSVTGEVTFSGEISVGGACSSDFLGGPVTLDVLLDGVSILSESIDPGVVAAGSLVPFSFSSSVILPIASNNVGISVTEINDVNSSNDTLFSTLVVQPIIGTFPYVEDFESGPGGWESDGAANSSWQLGTPASTVIIGAASGVNAWKTNLTGLYSSNEQGAVESPCLDFSTLCEPSIEMNIWYESEFSWDGANLQSSIDGKSTWQNVGAVGDPNNWYTDGTINGTPGGSGDGWTGRNGGGSMGGSNGYVLAEHALDGLGGAANVFLRVNFGSDGSVQDDGFAFDDVHIFEAGFAPLITVTETSGDADDDAIICPGDMITLTATTGATYLWGGGEVTQAITVNPTADQTYNVTVSDGLGCDKDISFDVTVFCAASCMVPTLTISEDCIDGTVGQCSYLLMSDNPTDVISADPAVTQDEINGFATTPYNVTVTDVNGCSQVYVVNKFACDCLAYFEEDLTASDLVLVTMINQQMVREMEHSQKL